MDTLLLCGIPASGMWMGIAVQNKYKFAKKSETLECWDLGGTCLNAGVELWGRYECSCLDIISLVSMKSDFCALATRVHLRLHQSCNASKYWKWKIVKFQYVFDFASILSHEVEHAIYFFFWDRIRK